MDDNFNRKSEGGIKQLKTAAGLGDSVAQQRAAAAKIKPETRAQQAERHHNEHMNAMAQFHNDMGLQFERHHVERRGWYWDEKARLDGQEMKNRKTTDWMLTTYLVRFFVECGILGALIYMIVHYN